MIARPSVAAAQRAFQRGAYHEVLTLLAGATSAEALHLVGLAQRRLGDVDSAYETLSKAAVAQPNDPALARNLGLAARSAGDIDAALAAFERATELAPSFVAAWQSRGRAALDLERFDTAEQAFVKALKLDSGHVSSRYGLACVYVETGRAADARRELGVLQRAGRNDASIEFMLGRCELAAGDVDAAIVRLTRAHHAEPSELSLKTLAEALWMNDMPERFEQLIDAALAQPGLGAPAIDLARQADNPQLALAMLDRSGLVGADADAVRALTHIDIGAADDAESAARAALAADPTHRAAVAALVSALLMQGRGESALDTLAPMRAREPLNQNWLAYEATALRIAKPDAYATLLDHGRLVREFELPVPAGFASLDAFNTALLTALDQERPYRRRPLAQSLRGGNQTQNDLKRMTAPVVRAYLAALRTPVATYLEELDVAANHPLASRRTDDFRIAECWSVELEPGGYHVSHVHPRGWLSSAYYAYVPRPTADSRERREGWIKFGEPPFATIPDLPPDQWIEPRAGLLVLFPSFLWHGTAPFATGARRVTAP
ncbi:MAG: tetratricopeptide repeat protein, partial [Pseudomonadota bacterium]